MALVLVFVFFIIFIFFFFLLAEKGPVESSRVEDSRNPQTNKQTMLGSSCVCSGMTWNGCHSFYLAREALIQHPGPANWVKWTVDSSSDRWVSRRTFCGVGL